MAATQTSGRILSALIRPENDGLQEATRLQMQLLSLDGEDAAADAAEEKASTKPENYRSLCRRSGMLRDHFCLCEAMVPIDHQSGDERQAKDVQKISFSLIMQYIP